mgnify:CR=1 FL=1
MLVLKSVNLVSGFHTFMSSIMALVLGLIGLAMIFFAIYMKIKDIKFKKNGIPVKLKVKEVKENKYLDENNHEIRNGYTVTFEFVLNGIKKEETVSTTKKFKVNSIKDGIYLEDSKSNNLSVEGEGFFVSKGATIFLISFGIIILFLVSYMIFDFSVKILLTVILTYFGLLLGVIYFFPILFPQKKKSITTKKDMIEKTYYKNANNNEYSTVSNSLVRYVPKSQFKNANKKHNNKPSFANIMFLSIFIIIGGLLTCFGIVGTYNTIKVKLTCPTTIGKIEEIYKYTQNSDDGVIESTGIIYKYSIHEKEYKLDYKTGSSYEFNTHKVGDKEKIYYQKNNPENAIAKSALGKTIVPLVIGVLFIYIALYVYVDDKRKQKLYEMYILKGGK